MTLNLLFSGFHILNAGITSTCCYYAQFTLCWRANPGFVHTRKHSTNWTTSPGPMFCFYFIDWNSNWNKINSRTFATYKVNLDSKCKMYSSHDSGEVLWQHMNWEERKFVLGCTLRGVMKLMVLRCHHANRNYRTCLKTMKVTHRTKQGNVTQAM